MNGRFCCFFCPEFSNEIKAITSVCPHCNLSYEYPKTHAPNVIIGDGIEYQVVKYIGRGFYAATYLCKKPPFGGDTILKVTPKILYDELKKDKYDDGNESSYTVFQKECRDHKNISRGSRGPKNIVDIITFFQASIKFCGDNGNNKSVDCYVSELEYIQGSSFNDYIANLSIDVNTKAKHFAQLAIDLFTISAQLKSIHTFHNDMHGENLIVEELVADTRQNELVHNIRLVLIDLNSVSEIGRSTLTNPSDRTQIRNHLILLANILKQDLHENRTNDLCFHTIETIEKIIGFISSKIEANRDPDPNRLIEMVREDFRAVIEPAPWDKKFLITRLHDDYNAQTIQKCYIPLILVDDDQWVDQVAINGPVIITGMRGCGKTTILGALDFHARALTGNTEDKAEQRANIVRDPYVALSLSCADINVRFDKSNNSESVFATLIILYTIKLFEAIRHLKSIDPNALICGYQYRVRTFLCSIINLDFTDIPDDTQDAEFIIHIKSKLWNPQREVSLNNNVSISVAFVELSKLITGLTEIWNDKKVFFLLDDASTRYLSIEAFDILLSNLIFQSSYCSFKITTEDQTLALAYMKSPGLIERAREGRDYKNFKFGETVYKKLKSRESKKFILNILDSRRKYYENHPKNVSPKEILGDCYLEDIAIQICNNEKGIYKGISALTHFCVGDIGDVLYIYDNIMLKYINSIPVSSEKQAECYLQMCHSKIHNSIFMRDSKLQKYADSFAKAANHMLRESYKQYKKGETSRVRQFTQLYLTTPSIDTASGKQAMDEIVLLVDAGIFVFISIQNPRMKSDKQTPFNQTRLAYRKLLGLKYLIGLSDRDRFELNEKETREWLECPDEKILISSANKKHIDTLTLEYEFQDDETPESEDVEIETFIGKQMIPEQQLSFFDRPTFISDPSYLFGRVKFHELELNYEDKIETVIIPLGFEERSYMSACRTLDKCNPQKILLLKYPINGYKEEDLVGIARKKCDHVIVADVSKQDDYNLVLQSIASAYTVLFDISGMSRHLIYSLLKIAFDDKKPVCLAYTEATEYKPTNEELNIRLRNDKSDNIFEKYANLMKNLDIGEGTNYTLVPLCDYDYSDKPKTIIGFALAKSEKLFRVLNQKEYARIELLVTSASSERAQLAQTAASIAKNSYGNVNVTKIEHKSINQILDMLLSKYYSLCINQSTDTELALIGTKLQTVACAALSSIGRLKQVWHVVPDEYDAQSYSSGVGEKTYYYSVSYNEITYDIEEDDCNLVRDELGIN